MARFRANSSRADTCSQRGVASNTDGLGSGCLSTSSLRVCGFHQNESVAMLSDQSSASTLTLESTASNIGSVKVPVKVFCWLG